MTPTKQYIINADLIRIGALFAVVGIHLLTPIYARPDFFGGSFWWLTFLLNCLFRASVPLFVMLSGYLLLGKETSLRQNAERTVKRIVVPFFAFYLINFVYNAWAASMRQSEFDYTSFFHNLSKNSYTYLYFLIILAFLYALVPLFRLVFSSQNKQLAAYVIGFFFVNAIVATVARFTSLRVGDVFNTYTTWILWVGYFLAGYWIRQHQAELVKYQRWLIAALLIGLCLTVGLGYWSWVQHWQGNDLFYIGGVTYPEDYLSVGVILVAVSSFVLMIRARFTDQLVQNESVVKLIKWLAEVSFGVYLIHPIVIDFLNKFCGVTADNPAMPNIMVYVAVNAVLTFGVSILLAVIVNKTPLFRKIVGR